MPEQLHYHNESTPIKITSETLIAKSPWEGKIEIIDLSPEEPKTEVPVLVAPGWVSNAKVHEESIRTLAELGRHTIGITAPHGVSSAYEDKGNPMTPELRKAWAIRQIIHQKNLEKVDVIAHSEGALFVTYAALQEPSRFRNIIYFSPAGLIGNDSFWKLALRFSHDILLQGIGKFVTAEQKTKISTANQEGIKNILAAPKKSTEEVTALATLQIQENLKALKKQGVGIIIVHPVNDKAFPMNRMQEIVTADMVDGFISVGNPEDDQKISNSHNAWFLSGKKYAKLADHCLSMQEKKQAKKIKS